MRLGSDWPRDDTRVIAATSDAAMVAVSATSPMPISPRAARITTQPMAAT